MRIIFYTNRDAISKTEISAVKQEVIRDILCETAYAWSETAANTDRNKMHRMTNSIPITDFYRVLFEACRDQYT